MAVNSKADVISNQVFKNALYRELERIERADEVMAMKTRIIKRSRRQGLDLRINCGRCKWFVRDIEYGTHGLGSCKSTEAMEHIVMVGYDEFYLSADFGCIFGQKASDL